MNSDVASSLVDGGSGAAPRHTPLYSEYTELKNNGSPIKIVDFAGWALPVQFVGLIDEHNTVRNKVGVFDVSHMGEVRVSGPDALADLQRLLCNDASVIVDGQAQYTALLNDAGGVIDDLIIYRIAADEILLCVNASNAERDYEWILERVSAGTTVRNESAFFGLLAVQGPLAASTIARDPELASLAGLKPFRFLQLSWRGVPLLVARTGYTGEDGFEFFVPWSDTVNLWRYLVNDLGVAPIGLGARDTLRLEAGYPLHGQELSPEVDALSSGLGWIVKLNVAAKKKAVGFPALARIKEGGVAARLVGYEIIDPGIARTGSEIVVDGLVVGQVTSGTRSPTLNKSVGMARVATEFAEVGRDIFIRVRGKDLRAKIVALPFYKREPLTKIPK